MNIKKFITGIVFFSLPFYFVSCGSSSKKSITISGAFALYPLGIKWTEQYKKLHPDVGFDVSAGGAGKGLTDVLAGAADIAMFSRALTPVEAQKGVVLFAVAKDAVLPAFSSKNPFSELIKRKGLTYDKLKEIYFSGKNISWGSVLDTTDNHNISVYTRSDAAGAADTWAAYFGGKQSNIKGTGIFGDPGLADAVAKDEYGVGFNNVAYMYDVNTGNKRPGIEVIPIDKNGNGLVDDDENFYGSEDSVLAAITDGRYPSPPARDLYFLTKGKPTDPQIVNFLKWVLTDGQQYVKAAGYVTLPKDKIEEQLAKLK